MFPDKMRAALVVKPGEVVVKDVDVPKIKKNEVLIRVKYCGICGTDLHIFDGSYSREYLPFIPGHEFVGHIVKVGDEVKDYTIGERVTADINLSCGKCFYCMHNQILMCKECRQIGIHLNGAFAEYVAIPEYKLYRLPESMSIEDAALIEPVSCVVRAARKSGLTFSNSVLIIGAGSIGLLHLQMAKNCGAAPIIILDRSPQRLEFAKKIGADFTLLAGDDNVEEVRKLTEGRGADYVIEGVGSVATYEKTFQFVRPGGRIVAFGLADARDNAKFNPFQMVLNENSMFGSCSSSGNDFSEAITMIQYNRFLLESFTSTIIPLDKIDEGFDRAKNDKSILKILISMY